MVRLSRYVNMMTENFCQIPYLVFTLSSLSRIGMPAISRNIAVKIECTRSNGIPVTNDERSIPAEGFGCHISTEPMFIIIPYINSEAINP